MRMNLNQVKLAIDPLQEFFRTARERYQIKLRRDAGEEPPWTTDPAFLEWRFCNVHREDDKVTVWIRDNVREPLRDDPYVVTALALCRMTNRISTLEALKKARLFDDWCPHLATRVLSHCIPVTGGAYIVRTPNGLPKGAGIAAVVECIHHDRHRIWTQARTLQHAHALLQSYPCIGSFLAYEIISDLRHTDLLCKAPDIMTWAVPGPGATLGLGVFDTQLGGAGQEIRKLAVMRELLLRSQDADLWPKAWPSWEMREVEHWLCEFAKWCKAVHLGQSLKRRFP